MALTDKGTITFWLSHEHEDWRTNQSGYDFGRLDFPEGISVLCAKHPDGQLELIISRPQNTLIRLLLKIPRHTTRKELFVAIVWENENVKAYLDEKVKTRTEIVRQDRRTDVNDIREIISDVKEKIVKSYESFQDRMGVLYQTSIEQQNEVEGESKLVKSPPIKYFEARIIIKGETSIVPLSSLSILLYNISTLLNIGEVLSSKYDLVTSSRIIESEIESSKFQLIASKYGSFDGMIKATENGIAFLANKISVINAIGHGYSRDIAKSYVLRKEAENKKIIAETEKIEAEKIKALAEAQKLQAEADKITAEAEHVRKQSLEVTVRRFIDEYLSETNDQDMPTNQMNMARKYTEALINISDTLTHNKMEISIDKNATQEKMLTMQREGM